MTEQSAIVAGVDLGDADLAATVRGGLAEVEKQLVAELSDGEDFLTEAALHLVSAGGKRFRPLFTLLTAQVGPNPDAGEVFTAATVVELVHLATLYHDDVMDEATMRRGAPSANARWGNSVAILAGDYLFAHASRLVSTLGTRGRARSSPTPSPNSSPVRCARPSGRAASTTPSSTTSR